MKRDYPDPMALDSVLAHAEISNMKTSILWPLHITTINTGKPNLKKGSNKSCHYPCDQNYNIKYLVHYRIFCNQIVPSSILRYNSSLYTIYRKHTQYPRDVQSYNRISQSSSSSPLSHQSFVSIIYYYCVEYYKSSS